MKYQVLFSLKLQKDKSIEMKKYSRLPSAAAMLEPLTRNLDTFKFTLKTTMLIPGPSCSKPMTLLVL